MDLQGINKLPSRDVVATCMVIAASLIVLLNR